MLSIGIGCAAPLKNLFFPIPVRPRRGGLPPRQGAGALQLLGSGLRQLLWSGCARCPVRMPQPEATLYTPTPAPAVCGAGLHFGRRRVAAEGVRVCGLLHPGISHGAGERRWAEGRKGGILVVPADCATSTARPDSEVASPAGGAEAAVPLPASPHHHHLGARTRHALGGRARLRRGVRRALCGAAAGGRGDRRFQCEGRTLRTARPRVCIPAPASGAPGWWVGWHGGMGSGEGACARRLGVHAAIKPREAPPDAHTVPLPPCLPAPSRPAPCAAVLRALRQPGAEHGKHVWQPRA